jgi:hypothetical protein
LHFKVIDTKKKKKKVMPPCLINSFYMGVFFPLSLPRLLPDLTVYTCIYNRAGVLSQAVIAYPSRAPEFTTGFFGRVCLCSFFSLFVLSYYVSYVLHSVLWCMLRFPHGHDVRFVFAFSCLLEGLCLVYVVCVCLHVVVSGSCCVVSIICFSLSCVPCVDYFSPSVFSDVYFFYILVTYIIKNPY